MSDTAEIITALVGAGASLAAACRFVWNKIEKRFAAVEAELDHCRVREAKSIERRAVQLTVIELLWQEVMRHAPNSLALTRGKKLLDELKDGASHDI